jgi:RHS repeat-associated protein
MSFRMRAVRASLLALPRARSPELAFYYDGLGRQILRYVDNQWIYSAWDGWDLVEEYDINGTVIHTYVHGGATDELVARFDPGPAVNRIWYYQDAQGSTTHLGDDSGNLVESYKYPPADSGAPAVFNGAGQPIGASAFDNRFLYTGRDYYRQGGFYDYRNRSYLPTLGRFLQSDPLGFGGDANLYRYCGNNPVNGSDPMGTDARENDFGYGYVAHGGSGYVAGLAGTIYGFHVENGTRWLQCAGAAQYLAGGYGPNGNYYEVPSTSTWFQGASLNSATEPGTLIATGWQNGGYPSESIARYREDFPGSPINHAAIFGYFDDRTGNAIIYSQNPNGELHVDIVRPQDQWQFNEVYIGPGDGPYASRPSTDDIVGRDPSTGAPVYAGRPDGGNDGGGGFDSVGSAFFGYGVFDIQNSRGLQGAGRDFWLVHTFKKH